MARRQLPPFRADHVGSLLRPAALLEARRAKAAGEINADQLRVAEDDAIRDVVRMQESVGLQSATDETKIPSAASAGTSSSAHRAA